MIDCPRDLYIYSSFKINYDEIFKKEEKKRKEKCACNAIFVETYNLTQHIRRNAKKIGSEGGDRDRYL